MNDLNDFRTFGHQMVDWMADYLGNIGDYPVKSQVQPKEIIDKLPLHPPDIPEGMDRIFRDFREIIVPGMTHWQSPSFFGYFPANSSLPSLLAEMLTAAMGAQCMIWETSPAAAELEERMMEWLAEMTGLPAGFTGVIQDTASTSTLCALLTARERATRYRINDSGFTGHPVFRVYGSVETHSSIEKAVKIAGLGRENLIKVKVDGQYRIDPVALEDAIRRDESRGFVPLCIVATLGTTGSTAIDPLDLIAPVAQRTGTWLHVDAAMAGTALLLPEYRWMTGKGIEKADSFVFNPHKWMFTNFDCSAYFVRDPEALIRTFGIQPEYLKTVTHGRVNDYRDWGIQLGRRFRALKLWFVIRSFGVNGLRQMIRQHIEMAEELEQRIREESVFELLAPRTLNLVCFRYHPPGIDNPSEIDRINEKLLQALNKSGKLFLTHTRLNGMYTLRMVIGQTRVDRHHVIRAWNMIRETAARFGDL
ncbi:MAG: aspartate aminotransferase family protein [Bacteroidales bacterium]|nr:aspartate aminotransferase family protein [Bacteroidales bacterium]